MDSKIVDLNVTLEDEEVKELETKVDLLASNIARIQEAIEKNNYISMKTGIFIFV